MRPPIPKTNQLSRRGFLASAGAVAGAQFLPKIGIRLMQKRVVTVYFDKALGAMRLVEKLVP